MYKIGVRLFFGSIFLSVLAQYAASAQKSGQVSSVVQEQLKGLRSLFLIVYVDFDIPNNDAIEKDIKVIATRMFNEANLSLKGEQGAHLSIHAYSYPIEESTLTGCIIVQVRTELSEQASMLRDSSLRNPHGYVTWSKDAVAFKHQDAVRSFILDQVKDEIEDFCIDWKTAQSWPEKK